MRCAIASPGEKLSAKLTDVECGQNGYCFVIFSDLKLRNALESLFVFLSTRLPPAFLFRLFGPPSPRGKVLSVAIP